MSTFFRINSDRTREPAYLDGVLGGPFRSTCWLLGGGPSLARLPLRAIAASPVPKMAVNLAGAGLIRPTLWTSYDNSARFHASTYLDAGITKFVQTRRAMDLVPGTTYKVCECPGVYFFERDGDRGFADFLDRTQTTIVDWADSFVQAIDILYRLGFRRILLAGCEMRVRPSRAQVQLARRAGVSYDPRGLLKEFLGACQEAGVSAAELNAAGPGRQYHFDETKPILAAANTDLHYFRVVQYLRLSRRSLALAGVELVSVTPGSRLNDYVAYVPAREALAQIYREIPDPARESTHGLYREIAERGPEGIGAMRDFLPLNWRGGQPPGSRVARHGSQVEKPCEAHEARPASPSPLPVAPHAANGALGGGAARLERQELVAVVPEPDEPGSKQRRVLEALAALDVDALVIREEG